MDVFGVQYAHFGIETWCIAKEKNNREAQIIF